MPTSRILTTHAGSLPRADALRRLVFARAGAEPYDAGELNRELRAGVAEAVRRQVACGIDVVNDGELGKTNFNNHVRERLAGYEVRERRSDDPPPLSISARDARRFGEFLGRTIEHWMRNAYYPTQEAFVYATAEATREEYRAIVEAGFILQIDDPDLPDAWQMYPEMTVEEYRRYAALRVDALSHALRDLPRERITLHVCWGSFHGPHQNDIPLEHIIDLTFRVRASRYSIEASNPVHAHEWQIFETTKVPEGTVLIPGVVGHCTAFIEHPELVAERLSRDAKLVGSENVMAGTDCGLGPRVGHPEICWAKLESLARGARLASERLWARA